MRFDGDREGFVFVSQMTFPFDIIILNIKLQIENIIRR